jgi:hypothetical protein
MKYLSALVTGIRERNNVITTSYDYPLIEWYDFGRNLFDKGEK